MASGHPLTDEDRYPWLEIIRSKAEQVCADQQLQQQDYSVNSTQPKRYGIVIACSALKQVYRDILRGKKSISQVSQQLETSNPGTLPTYFVYLKGSRECLLQRMKMRKGHFMKSNMLDSQLETLESPEGEEGVVVVRVEDTTEEQVRSASEGLSNFVAP
ncbi:hypothetical protein BGZ46_002270 [Entomortierella lignicola]|nr:hypothetical protein BGZ46_002270 [Entomortierella lignicola]